MAATHCVWMGHPLGIAGRLLRIGRKSEREGAQPEIQAGDDEADYYPTDEIAVRRAAHRVTVLPEADPINLGERPR